MDRDAAYTALCECYDDHIAALQGLPVWTRERKRRIEDTKSNVITAVGNFIQAESEIAQGGILLPY